MAGAPPAQMGASREDYLMQQFRALAQRYEISDAMAAKLKLLEAFEIVLILDDSGSMATPLGAAGASPFARTLTRWDELKQTVGIIVDIAAIMDKDGLDIFFLNRATLSHVTSSAQLESVFASPPAGLTPITPVLQHVLQAKRAVAQEKPVLVVIMTDGQPTNPQGQVDIAGLRQVLQYERASDRFYVTFVACTDDESSVSYLNRWDRELKHVDVVDDYASERAEVQRKHGQARPFSVGDYVVKTLVGSIDPEMDRKDEIQSCCNVQ